MGEFLDRYTPVNYHPNGSNGIPGVRFKPNNLIRGDPKVAEGSTCIHVHRQDNEAIKRNSVYLAINSVLIWRIL